MNLQHKLILLEMFATAQINIRHQEKGSEQEVPQTRDLLVPRM